MHLIRTSTGWLYVWFKWTLFSCLVGQMHPYRSDAYGYKIYNHEILTDLKINDLHTFYKSKSSWELSFLAIETLRWIQRKNNGKRRRGDEVRFRDRIGNVTAWRVKSCILNLGLNKSDFCVMTRPSTTPKKCPSSPYMVWYVVP